MIFLSVIGVFTAVTVRLSTASLVPIGTPREHWKHILIPNDNRETRASPYAIQVCSTPGCVQAANNILNAIYLTVDPCLDFFQFACGQWIQDHPIPDDKSQSSTFSALDNTIGQQLKVELSANVTSPSRSINSARTLYASCMDVNKINAEKTAPISGMLAMFGGWPLLKEENEWDRSSGVTFTQLIADLGGKFGVEPLVSMGVMEDLSNSSQRILAFDEPSLMLDQREYYLQPEYETHRAAYKKIMYEVAFLILSDSGLPVPSNLNASIDNILMVETAIANITLPLDEKKNFTELNNRVTLGELYDIMPQLDWMEFVRAAAPPDVMNMIGNDTIVTLVSLKYLQQLPSVLQTITARQLADYALWRAIAAYGDTQGTTFDNIFLDLNRVLYGKKQVSERYLTCNSIVSSYLPLAVGAMYVSQHFSVDDKNEALDMVSNIRQTFRAILGGLDWMDEATKAYALEKERNIVELIGYPDFILDPTLLDNEYGDLNVSPNDTYFEQARQLSVWHQHSDFRKLFKPVDRTEYTQTPAVVNAFYELNKNSIVFPAGILQVPFFKGTYPKFVNYAAIGSVIGHELTHAFDDKGSQLDKDGNVENWWSDASAANFARRKQCMIDQYNNYTVSGTNLHTNGLLTLGENIADNGGFRAAYQAYSTYVRQHGEEPRLPGLLQFTTEQLFFLSFGNIYCGANTPDVNTAAVLGDPHSVNSHRVLGVLSNMPEFASAFQCRYATPYHPCQRCSVW